MLAGREIGVNNAAYLQARTKIINFNKKRQEKNVEIVNTWNLKKRKTHEI